MVGCVRINIAQNGNYSDSVGHNEHLGAALHMVLHVINETCMLHVTPLPHTPHLDTEENSLFVLCHLMLIV